MFEHLHHDIISYLASQGITKPTEIQKKAIPILVRGTGNALLLAPTGSGKTEAAILPLLNRLYLFKKQNNIYGNYILYITPLKALNRDVFVRLQSLCNNLGITIDVRHGDTTQYQRRKQALTPPHVLILTPETLQAILPGRRMREHLRTVFAVIIDEIHELAGSKRGAQLSLGLERLTRLVNDKRMLRIGLSATVGNPKEVARLLVGSGRNLTTVWAGYDSRELELRVEMPEPQDHHRRIARTLSYPIHSTARLERIVDLIETHTSTLVFTNTRSFAEVLASKMRALQPPFEFDVHHGSLAKDVRLNAERKLKQGVSKAIIATSSLELGIDIGEADLVIQYSSPREVSRALQRIGRAGHGVGRTAKGIVIATANLDDITESGVILRRAKQNKVEHARIHFKSWDVLMNQINGILLDQQQIVLSDIYSFIRSSYPYRDVSDEEIESLLKFMEERKMITVVGSLVERGAAARSAYYENLSTIPDVRQVRAVDLVTRASIGVLDEDYVIQNVEEGSIFVIRGKPWRVVSVAEDNEEIICAPISETEVEAPRWIGEMIPVPYEVAVEVADVWNQVVESEEKYLRLALSKRYMLTESAQNHLISTIKVAFENLGKLPAKKRLIIEEFKGGTILHAPFGTRTNETLGVIISALLATRMGKSVSVERDPYRILFISDGRIDSEQLLDIFRVYDSHQISEILRLALKHTQTFATRFVHVGKRMGIIKKNARFNEIPVSRLIKVFEESPVYSEALREVLHEKLDEKRALQVFKGVAEGIIDVHVVRRTKPSALGRLIIEEKTRFEVMGEVSEENEILRMLEERLLTKQFKLVCMGNADWESIRTVSTLDERIECPICGSKMIAAFPNTTGRHIQLLRKRRSGVELDRDELKLFEYGNLTASLISQYGKTALLVLAGRGIGPTTASRLLRPGVIEDRMVLLGAIAKAEKEYERTKPFWT